MTDSDEAQETEGLSEIQERGPRYTGKRAGKSKDGGEGSI